MSRSLADIPELEALESRASLIRIPPDTDVPLTPRVIRLIDSSGFRRLASISQLGLVSLVYPAAHHTRFEHSLGVFLNAILYLRRLRHDVRFCRRIGPDDAERFLVAALLHDLAHWPFCHPIEDMRLAQVPRHEDLLPDRLAASEISQALREDWRMEPDDVTRLLCGASDGPADRLLSSMLSGPIDIDKVDYLARDSLHAGVPYGRNFDQPRLIGSLCLNEAGDGLAVSDKGRTAAEMLVFARYVMFSEVYWHHAVRAATAMLQRAFFASCEQLDVPSLLLMTERDWIAALCQASQGEPYSGLCWGLFGPRRALYKSVVQISALRFPQLHALLAHRPYPWLVQFAGAVAGQLSRQTHQRFTAFDVLVDAPPQKLEVQFNVEVCDGNTSYRPLHEASPVVKTLVEQQFDRYVKQVRVFVRPDLRESLRSFSAWETLLLAAADDVDSVEHRP